MPFTAIYPGRLQIIKADLLLLSKCFESLGQFDSNGEITANCVIITSRGKKHHGDPDDWVYEGESVDGVFQFFRRKNAGLGPSRPRQRQTAVLHSGFLAFWFTAYIFDERGKTPCHDPELLQEYQVSQRQEWGRKLMCLRRRLGFLCC